MRQSLDHATFPSTTPCRVCDVCLTLKPCLAEAPALIPPVDSTEAAPGLSGEESGSHSPVNVRPIPVSDQGCSPAASFLLSRGIEPYLELGDILNRPPEVTASATSVGTATVLTFTQRHNVISLSIIT